MLLDYFDKDLTSLPDDIEHVLLDFYHLTNLLNIIESKPQEWHKLEQPEN